MQEQLPIVETPPMPGGSRASSELLAGLDDPRALQILSTEHWSLLASRSLSYNEIFTRTGMFLTFLGASLVALGLISAATGSTPQLALIVAVILATDLFIGLATLVRVLDASNEELACVTGMNRIRHAYRVMAPGVEPYFSSPFHDDAMSVLSTYGPVDTGGRVANLIHGLSTAAAMVGVVDAVLAGALAVVVALGVGAALGLSLVLGAVAFVVVFVLGMRYGYVHAFLAHAKIEPRFPAPPRV